MESMILFNKFSTNESHCSSRVLLPFDRDAKKELVPIVEFENRVHPNLNYRNRYLKGMYGGIPNIADIDFDELSDILD